MNHADVCHEVAGCPGLFIDAFRGKYLQRTQDPEHAFVLTHYHGDHYQNLPKDGKYQGSALIHCTPVTASLLVNVHKVNPGWVVEHPYEQTFSYNMKGKGSESAQITFYDANHCPGACIVFIQLPDGTCHLHTGDMRYHERFQSYPLLREAAVNRKLDIVYLDTTYSHPKHDFVSQDEAIESIARSVVELLGPTMPKTLVLLSCYSIGKEKVLWEAATRTNNLVYVNEKKYQMLQCIQGSESQETSSQIIQRCTLDEQQTPIHVVPMGLAGSLWPFFRPNFEKCANYARSLNRKYEKVVAFLPTGWADASKWNKEHAISCDTIRVEGEVPIDVEVRLVPYSEHSTYSELLACIQFLRPRKVVPTVFNDERDYRKIEERFRNLLDTKRVKQAFFRSCSNSTRDAIIDHQLTSPQAKRVGMRKIRTLKPSAPESAYNDDGSSSISEVEEIEVDKREKSTTKYPEFDKNIASLQAMGFAKDPSRMALSACQGDLARAIDCLIFPATQPTRSKAPGNNCTGRRASNSATSPPASINLGDKKRKQPTANSKSTKAAPITAFFVKKKKS